MVSRLQRRIMLRRKLHILRALTKSKSVKKSSIIMDAFLYIYKLKLQVEAIKREYQFLINHIQQVKVERLGAGFVVRVTCKKGNDLLVPIIEAFEEKNLTVLQARVTCKHFFIMEAIVQAEDDQAMDVREITQVVLKAIQKQN